MSIITLTTDFGTKDHFVAKIKGAIMSDTPEVAIVDITHQISPFNIMETAYVIENSYKHFPEKTIHIIGVDSEKTPENTHLVIKLNGQYFICADNGILSIVCNNINPDEIFEINIHNKIESENSAIKTFTKVACHLAKGGEPEIIGKRIKKIKSVKSINPFINDDKNQIIGAVLYIDNYGNVVTNIKQAFFKETAKGRKFEISVRNHKFNKIFNSYSEIVDFTIDEEKRSNEGRALALFNSSKYLEIAIYKSNPLNVGTASSLLGLKVYDSVTVSFLK
tara:strand:+ start:2837 stop:3670 length:834 start_codon:yes stop_codon:yes gene_type:complete